MKTLLLEPEIMSQNCTLDASKQASFCGEDRAPSFQFPVCPKLNADTNWSNACGSGFVSLTVVTAVVLLVMVRRDFQLKALLGRKQLGFDGRPEETDAP